MPHLKVKRERQGKKEATPKIRCWKLKEEILKPRFKEKVITLRDGVNYWWKKNCEIMLGIREEVLDKKEALLTIRKRGGGKQKLGKG